MTRRAGFSVVEFLVVLAIITLLLTLLIPAFMRGREAARRITCFNNQKQLILATHSYQASHGVLPSGCVDVVGPLAEADEKNRMSWITSLLPYLEQSGVYNAIDFDHGAFDVQNQTARATTLTTLLCPSSNIKLQNQPGPFSWTMNAPPGLDGLTSYAGCHHDVEAPIGVDAPGVFFRNSRIRPIDVTDGLSQTVYIGEVAYPSKIGWLSGSRSTMRNTGHPIKQIEAEADLDAEPPKGFVGGFGSRHAGGAIFAFGDGSARFIKESIDPAVYRLLGNRSDGEAIDDSSY